MERAEPTPSVTIHATNHLGTPYCSLFLIKFVMLDKAQMTVKWALGTLLGTAIALPIAPAHAQQICATDGNYEPAADTYRTIDLHAFSISVSIPENYRLMARQDGSVEILHPDDYEWLQCLANGGVGAHGYYSESIRQVAPDPAMSLREQTAWAMGYSINADGSHSQIATQVFPYQANGINGYVATSMSGYSVTFLGTVPGADQLLEVSAGCDCDVDIEAVTDLLLHIRPLE